MTIAELSQTARNVAALHWQSRERSLWGRPGEAASDAAQDAEGCGGLDCVEAGIYECHYWKAWRRLGEDAIAASPYQVTLYPNNKPAASVESVHCLAVGFTIRAPDGRTAMTGVVVLGLSNGSPATCIIHDWNPEGGWRTEEPFVADFAGSGKPVEVARLAVDSRVLWLIARDMTVAEHDAEAQQ